MTTADDIEVYIEHVVDGRATWKLSEELTAAALGSDRKSGIVDILVQFRRGDEVLETCWLLVVTDEDKLMQGTEEAGIEDNREHPHADCDDVERLAKLNRR